MDRERTPRDDGFRMPAEWEPHGACLMSWPYRVSLWGSHLGRAKSDYAEVARAVSNFEPVVMVCNPGDEQSVRDSRDSVPTDRSSRPGLSANRQLQRKDLAGVEGCPGTCLSKCATAYARHDAPANPGVLLGTTSDALPDALPQHACELRQPLLRTRGRSRPPSSGHGPTSAI